MNYEAPKLTVEKRDDEEFLNPWEFLEPFIKNRWVIFLIITVSLGIGVIYNLNAVPIYLASSTVVIRRFQSESPLRDKQTNLPQTINNAMDFNTYVRLVSSTAFCQKLVLRLMDKGYFEGVMKSESWTNGDDEKRNLIVRRLALGLRRDVKVENPKTTNLVMITSENRDRRLAQDVVNTLADIVMEYGMEEKRLIAKNSLVILEEQLNESRQNLQETEQAMYEYRDKHNILADTYDLDSFKARHADQIRQLSTIEQEIQEKQSKISQLSGMIQSTDESRFTAVIGENPTLVELHGALVKAEIERDNLLAQYQEKHPLVVTASESVNILRHKFIEELKSARTKLQFDLNVLKGKEAYLVKEMESEKEDAVKETEKDIEYIVLEQKGKAEKDMYNILLSSVGEVSVHASTLQESMITVAERAVTPEVPIKPNQKMNLFLSLLAGISLAVAFALGREYMDVTVRNPEDVKKATQLPVLSTVPLYLPKGGEEGNRRTSLYVSQHPKSLFSESITSLRTHLNIKLPQERPITLAVTSSAPKEGKSLIASNLACSMALDGRKTILIDADLHRPSIHKSFGFDKRNGLFDLIVDALNPRWSELDLTQLNFGDLGHLIRLKQWSGTMKVQWDSLPSPLVIAYDKGRPVGSNINSWREKFLLPAGFPRPVAPQFSLDDSEIVEFNSSNGDGQKAMEFLNQYPRLRYSSFFNDHVIRQYLKETDFENLQVLTAGTNPKNPSEILSSEQMQILIAILKEKYERIIIDCPPAWPLSDVSVLSPVIDALIWICRAGETPKSVFARNVEHIREVQPNIIGAVINAVDLRRDRYYYYGYSYYYYRYYKSNYAKDYSLDLGEHSEKGRSPRPKREQP
jgi:uncharacterized protein involved in exopolysaccharide biosynthesis/Mrp family chromosome partitioning ATPase